jgi:hypothetical protein
LQNFSSEPKGISTCFRLPHHVFSRLESCAAGR